MLPESAKQADNKATRAAKVSVNETVCRDAAAARTDKERDVAEWALREENRKLIREN
jgi:hypothetical protein